MYIYGGRYDKHWQCNNCEIKIDLHKQSAPNASQTWFVALS